MTVPLSARLYLGAMACAAVGMLAGWLAGWHGPTPTAPALMALLVLLAVAALHFPLQLAPHVKVDMRIAVHFACLLLFGVPLALLLVAAGELLGGLTLGLRRNPATGQRRRDPLSTLFNTSQLVVATGLGGAVYYALLPQVAPAPLQRLENLWAVPAAAATMYLANAFAVATMVGLCAGESPLAVWLAEWRIDGLQFAGLFLLGLAAALTGTLYPWAPLVLALPASIIYLSLKRSVQLAEQTVAAVEALADVVDMRDPSTYQHSQRVAACAEQLSRRLGLPTEEVALIRLAARVHDLGKVGVPDQVLFKPGKLDPEEWALMRRHSELGAQILARFPQYRRVRELVLLHHERYDGGGYPRGIGGDALPLGAQIIAVADAFDAMTAERPYRRALPVDVALAELRRGKEVQWHPEVVAALESLTVAEGASVPSGTRLAVAP